MRHPLLFRTVARHSFRKPSLECSRAHLAYVGMTGCKVRHVFYDFDQTISTFHVFKQLAGWEESNQFVAHPFAFTERGQICRIEQLNREGLWSYDADSHTIAGDEQGEPWTRAALGGSGRVEEFRGLLEDLQRAGVVLTVITKGYIGAVKKILDAEGLLQYFDEVYGNIGAAYGSNAFDRAQRQRSPWEGDAGCSGWPSKSFLIQTIMRESQLKKTEAVLVEDDPAEIMSVQGICEGILVEAQRGMQSEEMGRIRELAMITKRAQSTRTDREPLKRAQNEGTHAAAEEQPAKKQRQT